MKLPAERLSAFSVTNLLQWSCSCKIQLQGAPPDAMRAVMLGRQTVFNSDSVQECKRIPSYTFCAILQLTKSQL